MKENRSLSFDMAASASLSSNDVQSYFVTLIEQGALEGRLGQQRLIPELEPAVEIIHKVLAGAKLKVHIEVIQEPDTKVLEMLEEKRREAEEKANVLNSMLGLSYVTV